ncbi:MAG TPA: DUF3311 domain-containing protein [Candidatus Dormibacteraeota bacterium]|nr:DUF3311 domain-containing protein [Candidatus Dormibacteraeota bacterium]
MTPVENSKAEKRSGRWWHFFLLLLPYIALMCVPFYARYRPSLWGFPFFYWYQFLWVPLTALLIGWVYWMSR